MTPEAASALRDHLVESLEGEAPAMRRVIEAMPDDRLGYTPHEKSMPFGENVLHIAGAGLFFNQLIEKGEAPPPGGEPERNVPDTTAALAEQVMGMLEQIVTELKRFTPEQLAEPVKFMDMGPYPAVTYANWHLVHLIHHRGQLSVYLRLAGQQVPSIYGPSADVTMAELHGQ